MFCKQGFLKNFVELTGKRLSQSLLILNFLIHVRVYEFYEIFKNAFYYGKPTVAASSGLGYLCPCM